MARPNKANLEMASYWKTQIRQCEEEYNRWFKRCERISQRYRDERKTIDDERRNLNLFWSNVEILKPAIYSKVPVPICERRFLDKDTTGRVAATILERALRYEVQMSNFDNAVRRCRDDYLIVGRGAPPWVRYNPEFGDPISPPSHGNDEIVGDSGEPLETEREEEETQEERKIIRESLDVCYVHWQDYYQLPARVRTEEEIEGKARKIYMSRQDLIDRFGKTKGKKVPLDHVPQGVPDEGSKGLVQGKDGVQATVYEIWWKPTRKVYFIAKEYEDLLEKADDPLNLEGFFPCPPALMATTTNDTMIPVPDYVEAQDQYSQIDLLTKRIDVLAQALQVRGVYDASAQGVKRIFEEGKEPDLIPVDSWAMFAEKGGLKGVIDFIPLEEIAKTLQILIEVRKIQMEDLDHITGISDIMRGTTDARETMGAQRLKQNNGSGRLQARQDDVGRFCRDIISIMGEIISEHFDPKTLIQVSGALYDEGLDPPEIAPQVANQMPPPMMGHNGGPPMPMGGQPPQGMNGQMPPQMGQPAQPPGMMGQQPPMQGSGVPPSIMQVEPPQQKLERKLAMIAQALQLLRDDKLRGFRIDIETDSTVQADAAEEKASRIEFIEGVTKFIQAGAEVTMQVPEFAPLAAKMLQFAVRGFRVGRDLESAIEDFCEKAEQDAKAAAANPQAKVDPKVQAEQIKAATAKMEADAEMRSQQIEAASEAQNKQMEMRLKAMDVQIEQLQAAAQIKTAQIDSSEKIRDHIHGNIEAARDLHIGGIEHDRKTQLIDAQHEAKMKQAKEPKHGD